MKASYNRTVQYVHLVSNTVASNPLDIWTPSTNNIEPQIGDQIAVGYFRNFNSDKWEFSAEGYYRNLDNQIDYINGAELLNNEYLEGDLLSGKGRAYGLELYLQRKTGKLTGWVSYTLSRSELKVDGINNHEWYPAIYDQTHNFKLAVFYEINKRWSVSSNFVYTTGTPTTTPSSKYYAQGIAIPYNANETRNNYRLTDYNRLDIAFRLEGKQFKKSGNERKNTDYWVFSLYNVYSRRNAFTVDFKQTNQRFTPGQIIETEAIRTSIIGSIVPSVSYNFKF
jgi:TonB dependent receptor